MTKVFFLSNHLHFLQPQIKLDMNSKITSCTSLLLFLSLLTNAQIPKMGEFSQNEIDLKSVSYEPDAAAVVLVSSGESRFLSDLLETQIFFRVKILKESGKERGDIRIRYYAGDTNVEEITGVKAQVTTYENGIPVVNKLAKEDFLEVKIGNGFKELRITFPNVQVGSILEYSFKKIDRNITFLDGWTFPNDIPVLFSKYQITMIPQLEYKMIGQGTNFFTKSEKTAANGVYSWSLRNMYAVKEEPYMKNYRDYLDRVEFQLSRYQRAATTAGAEWEDYLNTWEKLGDEMIEYYTEQGFYRTNPLEKEVFSLDLNTGTEKEKAQKAYYYIRDNFINEGEDWIYTKQTLGQLLKSKNGAPSELILAYMGILRSLGITCDPVLIGSKGYGRSELVSFPFLNQFDEILLLANLDGKLQFLELSDPLAPFGYVDLGKNVKAGLLLQKNQSKLIPIQIRHNSNTLVFSTIQLSQETGELVMGHIVREFQYAGLNTARISEKLKKTGEPLTKLFEDNFSDLEIRDVTVENLLAENNFLNTNFKLVRSGLKDVDRISILPISYSSFKKNPFTLDFRVFPVDFQYAFSETYTSNIHLPDGYEVDDYPTTETLTISNNAVVFSYQVELLGEILKVTGKFEVKQPLIEAENYPELRLLMESVASKLSSPVIFKKIAKPENP